MNAQIINVYSLFKRLYSLHSYRAGKCVLKIALKLITATIIISTFLIINACSNKTIDPKGLEELTGVWELSTTVVSNSCDGR